MTYSELKQKIVLGTVQLGLPYGINNTQGKPDQQEAFRILNLAGEENISLLDTADAYGDSTETLGKYLRNNSQAKFGIINKFIDDGLPLENKLFDALKLFGQPTLYAYMFHRFADYTAKRNLLQQLKSFRERGLIANIGISVYGVEELSDAIDDPDIDLIQVPLNPFDNSVQKKSLIEKGRINGKQFHVRSIFLQGLLMKEPEDLSGNLTDFHQTLRDFHDLRKKYNLSVLQLCLNYALHQKHVGGVLIGIENAGQLKQNIEAILPEFSQAIVTEVEAIAVTNPALLNPGNWKL